LYTIVFNYNSKDKRVEAMKELCQAQDIPTADINSEVDKSKCVLFIEPRGKVPDDACEYKHVFDYVRLSTDEEFVRDNNYLTALAMKKIFLEEHGTLQKKILLMGWGKLATQIERVFTGADLHLLDFNQDKKQEFLEKYGEKAFFESAPLKDFDIVINTIPKNVVDAREFAPATKVYELASPPYGISGDTEAIDYQILPGLPGVYSPVEAARIAFDSIQRNVKLKQMTLNANRVKIEY